MVTRTEESELAAEVEPPAWLMRLRRPNVRVERTLLAAASVVMVAAAVLAIREGDLAWADLRWAPLALAAVIGVPATLLTNAAEFALSARFVDRRVGGLAAVHTTLLATAANLLPLPGGPVVRVRALAITGVGVGPATTATLVMGAGWVGVAALLASAGAVSVAASPATAVAMAGLGGAALLAGGVLARRLLRSSRVHVGWFAAVLGVEIVSVLATALRIWLVLIALGVEARPGVALTLALAGVLANVVGIVPAGLGVREALSAGLAVLVAVPAATGFLVSLVDRVVGLAVTAPAAMLVSLASQGPTALTDPPSDTRTKDTKPD